MRNCGQVISLENATLEEIIKLLKQSSPKDVLEALFPHEDAPDYVEPTLHKIHELWTTWKEDTVESVSYWLMEMLSTQILILNVCPVKY